MGEREGRFQSRPELNYALGVVLMRVTPSSSHLTTGSCRRSVLLLAWETLPPPQWPSQLVAENPAHRARAFVVRGMSAAVKTSWLLCESLRQHRQETEGLPKGQQGHTLEMQECGVPWAAQSA